MVSGSGTILRAIAEHDLPVVVVLADRPCAALGIAEDLGVPAELVERTARDHGVPLAVLGSVGGDVLAIDGVPAVPVAELRARHAAALSSIVGE